MGFRQLGRPIVEPDAPTRPIIADTSEAAGVMCEMGPPRLKLLAHTLRAPYRTIPVTPSNMDTRSAHAQRPPVRERSRPVVYGSSHSETSLGFGLERIRETDLSCCSGRSYCHSMTGPGNATVPTDVSAATTVGTRVQKASACLA